MALRMPSTILSFAAWRSRSSVVSYNPNQMRNLSPLRRSRCCDIDVPCLQPSVRSTNFLLFVARPRLRVLLLDFRPLLLDFRPLTLPSAFASISPSSVNTKSPVSPSCSLHSSSISTPSANSAVSSMLS